MQIHYIKYGQLELKLACLTLTLMNKLHWFSQKFKHACVTEQKTNWLLIYVYVNKGLN